MHLSVISATVGSTESLRIIFLEAVSKGSIDYIVDTSTNDPKTIAGKILDDLNFREYF